MTQNFLDISYLKQGNEKQKEAYRVLHHLQVFESLKQYRPILTGTIPISIDTDESDLDIICQSKNHDQFSLIIKKLYGSRFGFSVSTYEFQEEETTIARFVVEPFELEIFCQDIPTFRQNAYRHMLVEHALLEEKGEAFRNEVISMKKRGLKTEPAFAELMGLKGDPYKELLKEGVSRSLF